MKKQRWSLLSMLLAVILVLVACNDDGKTKEDSKKTDDKKDVSELFSLDVANKGDAIEGGTLKVALMKDEPFAGIFSWELNEDGYDSDIMDFTTNLLFESDGDFLVNDKGIASLEVDQENNKAKVKIREGVKWSDGEPLTIEDVIRPYLIIGHKDYTGVRYDGTMENIIGMEEYHAGTADSISGLVKVDDTTLEISFKKLSPAIFSIGDGLWGYAAPDHIFKDLPVADLVESDAVRKNPVTLGAFKFDKIVPGESVQLVKNEYYWKGEPKLDGILIKVVPTSSISAAIKSGEYDIALNFNATKMEEIEGLDNITVLGRPELYYSYMGFKVGKYDFDKGLVITDEENSKMGNKKLRQAMGYALDIEQVSEVYYNNLRERANSLIPPVFKSFYDGTLEGYTYDPEKAKKLLDEAGYKDVDKDGFREDPNGDKLEIKLASMSSDTTQEDIISFYLQNWKDVGLNVTLATGRLIEFNSFYEKVQADDPEIDVFMAAWATGTNPSPVDTYSAKAEFNLARYTSEDLEKIITNIDSKEAFDAKYRAEQFRAWQEYMVDNATVIPMQFRYEIIPVNNRVKNWNIDYENETKSNLQDVQLVAEESVKSSK